MVNNNLRPFIIWTLQRTGGTNLTTRLVELSGLGAAPHEPFNSGRVYGNITQAWIETHDRASLDASMHLVVSTCQVIKHCVETVPWEVTESLAQAATKAGYLNLFLYRKAPLDRLLSLQFAKTSGIWGPDMVAMKALTGGPELDINVKATNQPLDGSELPVDELLKHERKCVSLLRQTWGLLEANNAAPAALAYEDVYRVQDLGRVEQTLDAILSHLGLTVLDAEFSEWVKSLVGRGDQGTREQYKLFPGYAELTKRCVDLPSFLPNAKLLFDRLLTDAHPWVEHFAIDVLPNEIVEGEPFVCGGVCVLSQNAPEGLELMISFGSESTPLEWGVKSPRMAAEYPSAKNGQNARWIGKCRLYGESNFAIIELAASGLPSTPLGELILKPEENRRLPKQ